MDSLIPSDLSWVKSTAVAFLLIYGLTALKYGRFIPGKKKLSLPPGPPGLPIIGNVFDIPAEDFWLKYKEWSDKYGSDLIYLNLLGTDVIVLNTLDACKELLEKRSSIYSSRPMMPMLNDLIGFDWHFAFMPYGEEWKVRRKVFTQSFGQHKAQEHRERLKKHIRNFLLLLLDDPDHFREHGRLTAGAFILDITYGIDVKSPDDLFITQAERGMQAMSEAGTAATYIVDFIPSLKALPSWLPGAVFKKDANYWRPHVEAMAREPFKFVQAALERGEERPCVATELLQELDENDDEYETKKKIIHDTLAAAYAAGSDTTVATTATFLLAMAQNPEVQKKAQSIVDKVITAQGRLLDFTEYKQLPYIDAIVREVLRWRPITPVGAPHSVIEDDVYMGYHIPRGATVISNCYAVAHDPALYGPNTNLFDPSRFLDPTQTEINPDVPMGYDAFGFGRRICPGLEIAVESLWLIVVSVLAVFDISRADEDDEGFGKYTSGLISHPYPFKINIVPRSKEAEAWIRNGVVSGA